MPYLHQTSCQNIYACSALPWQCTCACAMLYAYGHNICACAILHLATVHLAAGLRHMTLQSRPARVQLRNCTRTFLPLSLSPHLPRSLSLSLARSPPPFSLSLARSLAVYLAHSLPSGQPIPPLCRILRCARNTSIHWCARNTNTSSAACAIQHNYSMPANVSMLYMIHSILHSPFYILSYTLSYTLSYSILHYVRHCF